MSEKLKGIEKYKEIYVELTDEQYDESLDDAFGEVAIAGMKYSTSYALKNLDPTAYQCGKADYEDTLDHKFECVICGEVFDNEEDAEECYDAHD